MGRHLFSSSLSVVLLSLLLLLLCSSTVRAAEASDPVTDGYHGYAKCTASDGLNVRNCAGTSCTISENKPSCTLGERAYISGTVTDAAGNLWALLPGWGSYALNGRTYGLASAKYLQKTDPPAEEPGDSSGEPVTAGYSGWASCTAKSGLNVRNGPGTEFSISDNKPSCAFGERAYVSGTVPASDGTPWALLPGWGAYAYNGRSDYGLASAKYLKRESADSGGGGNTTPTCSSAVIKTVTRPSLRIANPPVQSSPGQRSADCYNKVIDQFNVEGNRRYKYQSGFTYCNIFLWDVTVAMHAEVPHYSGTSELNANSMVAWLEDNGEANGWRRATAAEAQAAANAGQPAIVTWKNPNPSKAGHMGVIRPGTASATLGPVMAQAGATNFKRRFVRSGFGTRAVTMWVHA